MNCELERCAGQRYASSSRAHPRAAKRKWKTSRLFPGFHGATVNAMGASNISLGSNEAATANTPGFLGMVGRDAQSHPIEYRIHAASIAMPFVGEYLEIPEGIHALEGLATGVEALKGASDLHKEVPQEPQQ